MSDILCPQCGHSINSTYAYFDESGLQEWNCDGGDCDCHLAPSDIASALLTAEPTEAEVDAAYAVWSRDFMAKPMREIIHDILKAAAEARRLDRSN